MQPSVYQEAIFGDFQSGTGNVVVEAYAGSGKTTTMIDGASRVPRNQKVLFCAFNKRIAVELEKRLNGAAEAKTLHSLGLRAVTREFGRCQIDENKTGDIASAVLIDNGFKFEKRGRTIPIGKAKLTKLVSFAKGTLGTSETALENIAIAQGLDDDPSMRAPTLARLATEVLAKCVADTSRIDFDDMIYFPAHFGLKPRIFNHVIIDETQDLNAAQLVLGQSLVKGGGRITAVGDRFQSIYGFRGADADAIPRMIQELNAKVLPLSICYRCPRSVVELAQTVVPGIEAAPDAIDGVVRSTGPEKLFEEAKPGDFVLSRTKAPLVRGALRFLAKGVPAMVVGKDLGRSITDWIEKSKAETVTELCTWTQDFARKEAARYAELENEQRAEEIGDQAETIIALCEGAQTVSEVLGRIDRLFGEANGGSRIQFSTVHKAKGLGADRVFLIADTFRPNSPWQEERNIFYVAVTRAKKELVFCGEVRE